MSTQPTNAPTNDAEPTAKPSSGYYSEYAYAINGTVISGAAMGNVPDERKEKKSLREIVGEMLREPEYCKHIQHDIEPAVLLYGLEPDALRDRVRHLEVEAARQRETYVVDGVAHLRKMRANSPIALCGVASYPDAGVRLDDPEVVRWRQLAIQDAIERWGEKLKAVYGHTDESQVHLHFFVDENGRHAYEELHQGHAASRAVRAQGGEREARDDAYKGAMQKVQDRYYEKVAKPLGWARTSEHPKPKTSRSKALQEKARLQAERDATLEARERKAKEREQEQDERELGLRADRRLVSQDAKMVVQRNSYLVGLKAALEADRKALADDKAAFEAERQTWSAAKAGVKEDILGIASRLLGIIGRANLSDHSYLVRLIQRLERAGGKAQSTDAPAISSRPKVST